MPAPGSDVFYFAETAPSPDVSRIFESISESHPPE